MRTFRIELYRKVGGTKTIERQVPEKWQDLSGAQFAVCARLFLGKLTDEEFIAGFFDIDPKIVAKLSAYEKYKLTGLVDFISGTDVMVDHFYMASLAGTDLMAPETKLKDVTFEHFMFFDTFFFDYVHDPTEDHLRKFVAAVYLRRDEYITDINFKERLEQVSGKVPGHILYGVFINYLFIRRWLSKVYPSLFEYTKEREEKKNRKPANPKQNRPDWHSILDALIGDDILNAERYKRLPCTQVFKTIHNRIVNYKSHGTRTTK